MMKDLITLFFPQKALQLQKIYLRRGMYRPHETDIWDFICRIDKMVDYLKKFPPFGIGQGFPDDNILELVDFLLTRE